MENKKQSHVPVLIREVLESLQPQNGDIIIDGTVGAGGHAREIVKRLQPDGMLVGLDVDPLAVDLARKNLNDFVDNVHIQKSGYCNMFEIVQSLGLVGKVSGVLLDLGMSSMQVDDLSRGFSFKSKDSLDMRFDSQDASGLTAAKIINFWEKKDLIKMIKSLGQERFAVKIVNSIVDYRQKQPLDDAQTLAQIISAAVPRKFWPHRIHPATRVFQSLRMTVNNELGNIEEGLKSSLGVLKIGGRIAVISFHSLEDKLVKNFFNKESKNCICPSDFPVCNCKKTPSLKKITIKPLIPQDDEIAVNLRSRSAKLRVAEKI